MDPAFTTMLDVIRIATFQSRGARHSTLERPPTDATTGDESASAAVHAAKWKARHFRRWLRFSLIAR